MFGVFMHFIPCISQEVPERQLSRDSLYRRISHEMRAEFSSPFTYGQGSSVISAHLGGNAAELSRLDAFVGLALSHPDYSVSRIRLTGYCSIEGRYSHNDALARKRAEQFYAYLHGHYPELREYPCDLAWVAEDWTGFSRLVKESSIGERDEILDIIRKVRAYDEREALLAKLNGVRAYDVIKRAMFPQLRRVELQIEYQLKEQFIVQRTSQDSTATATDLTTTDPTTTASTATDPTASTASPQPSPKERGEEPAASYSLSFGEGRGEAVGSVAVAVGSVAVAVKSNLLQWAGVRSDFSHATFLPNLSLEYFVTPHWSVELGAMYSYWHYSRHREFQGVSGYRLEPRYRWTLVRDRLEVFLGVYGRMGDYDMTTTQPTASPLPRGYDAAGSSSLSFGEGRGEAVGSVGSVAVGSVGLSGEASVTGDYWDAGLSAGFTVGLFGGWAVEVGARAGYLSTDAIRYNPDGKHNWFVSEHPYHKVKVTDLNISLVYRFKGVRLK